MAFHATRPSGCSGCLIDACVRHDERRLRHLLSDASVQFSDTYWVPRAHMETNEFMENFIHSPPTKLMTELSANAKLHCTHPVLAETLEAGKPEHIALSVTLMSMLCTSRDFNALKMLIDSDKFDLSEPLLFHSPLGYGSWSLVAVDLIGLATLFDRSFYFDDLLLKTLLCSSRVHSNVDFRLMEMWPDDSDTTQCVTLLANNAFSLIGGYHKYYYMFDSFKRLICRNYANDNRHRQPEFLLKLLKALCRMGLTLNADKPPSYCYRRHKSNHYTEFRSRCFLNVIVDMFDMGFGYSIEDKMSYVSEWLCNGWICAQRDNWYCLPVFTGHSPDGKVRLRILRQLLALGLFRDEDSEMFWSAYCINCSLTKSTHITHRQCSHLAPLADEFIQSPLTLMQLSRIEIRRLVGMNDFKNRMESLQNEELLPPMLLKYVWRANEMLFDVALQ